MALYCSDELKSELQHCWVIPCYLESDFWKYVVHFIWSALLNDRLSVARRSFDKLTLVMNYT